MKFPAWPLLLVLLVATQPALAHPHVQIEAKGVVFHDVDGDAKFGPQDKPLPGIRVSNGQEIVTTDEYGKYQLTVDEDTALFVIKPRGWRTPLSKDNLPQFYYLHKPHGSPKSKFPGVAATGNLPESVDFPLYPQEEPEQFKALLFGDTQPRDQKEVDYIAHDVVEELIGTDASFGVTLGDVVFDDLSIFKPLNSTIALIGIPWYNVIGNHDINYDAKHDHHSDETFESIYGPAYYSFDHGAVHFLVLDDIDWHIPEGADKPRYRGGLDKQQLEFIRNDLALIPEDQMVVLMMHIPLVDVHNRQELYRMIEKRPFCISISGHTHYHQHRYITKEDGWMGPEPHHHIINVTVCGSWWSGQPDERGIPHTTMRDGAPNGYSILSFDGTKYSLDFKAAGKPASYQMNILAPESVTLEKLPETVVWVNFFNGCERSTVEVKLGSECEWQKLERQDAVDPAYAALVEVEKQVKEKTFRDLPAAAKTPHLWKGNLPKLEAPGTELIHIRATDREGRVFHARRILRVTE